MIIYTTDTLKRERTERNLDYIKGALHCLLDQIAILRSEIETLEYGEMYFAREWWKDGKYLYHVFPTDEDGNRERVYIGCDPMAVATARGKVERWHRHRKLQAKLQSAVMELSGYQDSLGMMAERLKRSIGDNGQSVASNSRHQIDQQPEPIR